MLITQIMSMLMSHPFLLHGKDFSMQLKQLVSSD